MRRYLIQIMLLVFLFAGCAEAPPEGPEPLAVDVALVCRGDITKETTLTGTIKPGAEANLGFMAAGKIQEVPVSPGDPVEKGDTLASLDTRTMAAQMAQADAALAAARAYHSKAEKGLREEELEQIRAQVSQAQAAYELAEKNYHRMKTLFDQKAISLQQLEGAEMQMISAEAAYVSAKKQEEMALEGSTEEVLEAARAQVRQAEAAYLLADTQLDGAVVKAPFKGIVSYIDARTGEMAAPGMPVAGVVQTDPVFVELNVSERLVSHLKVGDTVRITVKSRNHETFGTVGEVAPAADPRTKAYKTRIEVANPDGLLKPGMFASARIPGESAKDTIRIPREAFLPGKNAVFVVVDGVARERQVEIGLDSGDLLEIRGGLSDGEKVVVKGQHFLSDGSKVKVVGDTP